MKMQASRRLLRVWKLSRPSLCNSVERVNSFLVDELSVTGFRRCFHSAVLFPGNIQKIISHTELNHQKDVVQIPLSSMVMPNRLFSSEAKETVSDSSDAETVRGVYDKVLNCVVKKRSAPPNALLWSLIAKCSSTEDIELLFDVLQKLRIFRLSNLRIAEGFNSALCREVTKACVRSGALDFGKKTLWKNNIYGLTPDMGSAHHLLLHAKQQNDVELMNEVMTLLKKNDVPLQPGTADIVFSICHSANRWDLISKYGVRFVESGVRLRQTSFELWMEFAAKEGDVASLWKIEKWRSEAMKRHSVSTGFSCAKGFLLEHKSENAAAVIQVLYQTLPGSRKPSFDVELQKLVSEWPLDVIKHQEEDNKTVIFRTLSRVTLARVFQVKLEFRGAHDIIFSCLRQAFAAEIEKDISAFIDVLPTLGVEAGVTMQEYTGKEALLS